MFKRENVVSALWSLGAFLWKSGLLIVLFFGGMVLSAALKRTTQDDAIVFWQSIGSNLSAGALFVLIMYWWQMDSTGDMQKDLKDLKKQNKTLEEKLDAQTALLQQLMDKANHLTTNVLTTPPNLTNTPSPDQAVVVSNGHVSNGN